MKIEMPNHDIVEKERPGSLDIPLGYIDTKDTTLECDVAIEKDFASDEKKSVSIYEAFNNDKIIFFDNNDKPITKNLLKRSGNRFIFSPKGMTEFTPTEFSAAAVIKKHMTYSSSKTYNLRVGAVETMSDNGLSPKLISVFGDAWKRGLCPANIYVNNGNMTAESLTNSSMQNMDFVFTETNDGLDYAGFDPVSLVTGYVNVWISAYDFHKLIVENKNYKKQMLDGSSLTKAGHLCEFYKQTERALAPKKIFNQELARALYADTKFDVTFPYEDVMVLQWEDSSCIIVTPDTFLKDIELNAKILYDVVMYLFLNGYTMTRAVSSWITDEPVDYAAYSKLPVKAYHDKITMNDLVSSEDYDIGGEYNILKFIISTKDVSFTGIDGDGNLSFRKTKNAPKDPTKPNGSCSYISASRHVYFYDDSFSNTFLVKKKALITGVPIDGGMRIDVSPLSNSLDMIYTNKESSLIIPDYKLVWFLTASPVSAGETSVLKLVEQSEYDLGKDGAKIATIKVKTKYKTSVIDLRVMGGGLPSGESPDYDLIDIGNVYGRPYRLGSTLIIRLPKKLEEHKEKIEKTVKDHMKSGCYPVFIFE